MKGKWLATVVALLLALGLWATARPQETTKVGFVYIGPVGDYGWTYAHDQLRLHGDDHQGRRAVPHELVRGGHRGHHPQMTLGLKPPPVFLHPFQPRRRKRRWRPVLKG